MEDRNERRIDFIDLTKGVCILLVVMLHVDGAFARLDSGALISCFCMPLYFFVSGLFFKSYEGFKGFFIRKINKLFIPFLIFYLSSFLLMFALSKAVPGLFRLPVRWDELLLVFRDHELIRFNPPVWFLVALFNCNILFYLIHYLRRNHLPLMFCLVIIVGAAGYWLGREHIALPLYLDVSMTALPFYFAGFWIRRYNFFLFPSHRFDKWIPLVIAIAFAVMYLTATPIGMRTNNYSGSILQVYLAAFAGIVVIMLLCKKTKSISLISYLGRYSIVTLGIHGPLLFFLRPLVGAYVPGAWPQTIVLLLLTLSVCLLLTPVITRLMPYFVAQKDLLVLSGMRQKSQ